MSQKKILIVGYGSMGRRRIRIISDLMPGAAFICVDSNPDRQKQAAARGFKAYGSLKESIAESPDMAFVCTSPGRHADIILFLLRNGIHTFTELNLTADRYDEIKDAAKEYNSVVFISSTLIYKCQMEKFKEIADGQDKPITYIYHVGQYLPDWHPWESYKDFFIGKKETNGIRELLAIQLPWMIRAFGRVDHIEVSYQQCTGLDIEFPDIVILNITHEGGNIGVFVVDVVPRKAVTRLEIIGEEVHLFWDGHNDDLYCLNFETKELEQVKVYESEEHAKGYADYITEEPYREEMKEFLKAIDGKKVRYGLDEDAYVLDIIDKIEDKYSSAMHL